MYQNPAKVEYEQRQGYIPQTKTRLSQLYRNNNPQSDQVNYQSAQINSNTTNASSQNKFMQQLYTKGYSEVDQNRRSSKLDSNKKDVAKIINSNQLIANAASDFTFKTPPDQFTKKKFSLNNKQASVQMIRPEHSMIGGSPNFNNIGGGSLQRQDIKRSPQLIQYTDKRKQVYQSGGSHSVLQNKENDSYTPSEVRLPKLDSYPNSPPLPKNTTKNEEYFQNQKFKKAIGEQEPFKISAQKEKKQQQQQSSNPSISDDTTSSSPPQVQISKSPQPSINQISKNYYVIKENNGNTGDNSHEQNTSSSNVLNIQSPKILIGNSPRYNIIKYKTNQQKVNSHQSEGKKIDNYPNQLIRPLVQSPDISESSINSSLINNSSDLAQIKKFEKKLKMIRENNDIPTKEKRNNELIIPTRETNSSLATYQQQMIQQMQPSQNQIQRKSFTNNMQTTKQVQSKSPNQTQKFKYPIMSSVLKTKAGQYSQFIRKQNQDAGLLVLNFMAEKHASLSGVYDGHGEYGTQVSTFVKKGIQKHLMKEIKQQGGFESENLDIPSCFRRAYQSTNKELLAQGQFDIQMSGCTAVTVLQYRNELYCANTGDSRAIVIRQNSNNDWKQVELSKDHKPEVPEEKARIHANGGRVEQSSNEDGEQAGIYRVWKKNMDLPGLAMSRSMGDGMGRECGVICDPEIIHHTLTEEDKMIILASDGVWEFLSNVDVTRIFSPFFRDGKINEAVDKVISLSHKEWLKEGESVDDITCIAFFIQGIKDGYEEHHK